MQYLLVSTTNIEIKFDKKKTFKRKSIKYLQKNIFQESVKLPMDMVSALNRGLAGVHVSCASAEMITEDMTDNMHDNMTRKTDISLTRKYINNYFVSELYFLKFARICNLRQYEQINVIVRRDFGFYAYRMRFFQDSCRTSYK